jgi:predicted TPR repeat methyltransferase
MATSRIHEAMEHHQRGRLAEAESIYGELLARNAEDADALHYLGVLRMAQGRRAEALELIKRALKITPRNAQAWNNLGNMLWYTTEHQATEFAYRHATNLKPDLFSAWFNLGRLLHRHQRREEALEAFKRAIQLQPRFAPAHEFLASIYLRMGNPGLAAECFRRWHEMDPDNPIARHMAAAAAAGNQPERADDAFVVSMFDRAATRFDEALAGLGYAAPQLLTAALAEVIPFAEGRLAVLDAGCGTGLCGPLLRSSARRLVGVDLSSGMLARARDRGVYDELHEGELVAFMRARPAAYDVVISADTLVYFGVLDAAMAAAHETLSPGGILAFTAEAEPAGSPEMFRLQGHGRYTHAEGYLRSCLASTGFEVLQIERGVLRQEGGADVIGHVVLARRH